MAFDDILNWFVWNKPKIFCNTFLALKKKMLLQHFALINYIFGWFKFCFSVLLIAKLIGILIVYLIKLFKRLKFLNFHWNF